MGIELVQLLREAAEKVEESGWSILAGDLAQAAASLEAQEPVAWLHENPLRVDAISDYIKSRLVDGDSSPGGIHRPLDDGDKYSIPLYRHPHTSAVPDAHEIWAAAQLASGEGIEDGVLRVSALLVGSDRAVPDGWQLVPVEPTQEMLDAAIQDGVCVDGKPVWKKDVEFQAKWKYQQMLAAAPQPEPTSSVPEGCVPLPREAYNFLMGICAMDGVWFGESHPTKQGTFWWRSYIRDLVKATEPQSAPTSAVPEGWKLVPVDLTEPMIDAWFGAPRGQSSGDLSAFDPKYKAMLAAAPQQGDVESHNSCCRLAKATRGWDHNEECKNWVLKY